jgi:hypothetical protein
VRQALLKSITHADERWREVAKDQPGGEQAFAWA